MSQPFLGQIALFPYQFAPAGWAKCQGQLLSVAQNTALFSLLGAKYGGDGTNTFGLPDLQGRVPVGPDTNYPQGKKDGLEQVPLRGEENPRHNHSLNATTNQATAWAASGNLLARAFSGTRTSANTGLIYSNNSNSPDQSLDARTIGFTGNSKPHNNIQPYLVLSYCVALRGIFPSRN